MAEDDETGADGDANAAAIPSAIPSANPPVDSSPSTQAGSPVPTPRPGKVNKFDRPKPPRDWRFFVGALGKVLIATGLLMFGFVAYQLWGTGIETARAQNALENEFDDLLAGTTPAATTNTTTTTVVITDDSVPVDSTPADTVPATVPVAEAVPIAEQNIPSFQEGDAIARLEIPRIGVDKIVVAGVEKPDLKKGPGHYPETPMPGQLGNSAIAGHRTTYGQPFYSIDKLQPGDDLIVTTPAGRFVYVVTGQQIVAPDDYQVIITTDPTVGTLTLTSCHPKWTTQKRIVVTSELDPARSDPVGEALINYGRPLGPVDGGAPAAVAPIDPSTDTAVIAPTTVPAAPEPDVTSEPVTSDAVTSDAVTTDVATTDAAADDPAESDPDAAIEAGIADAFAEGWFSDPSANAQVALWGVLLALIGIGSYLISRKFKRDWVGALVGIVPFAIALYFFFQNVNRLLPPNL